MNALSLSLFDSVGLATHDLTTAVRPMTTTIRVRRRSASLPSTLWRQSLAAHEPAASTRWTMRGCHALLGAMTLASVYYAATSMVQCVLAHDGLSAAVQRLMGH